MATQDESEQSSESVAPMECYLSGCSPLDGAQQTEPIDIDNRPVGRCYVELMRARAAVQKLRQAQKELEEATANVWKCRDAALEAVPTASAINWRSRVTVASFDFITNEITSIEKMIEQP